MLLRALCILTVLCLHDLATPIVCGKKGSNAGKSWKSALQSLDRSPHIPLVQQDALLMRGIFDSHKNPVFAIADLTQRHPRWWVWFPKTLAELQKKAERRIAESYALHGLHLSADDTQKLLAFFSLHPPQTRDGWAIYQKLASHHPQDVKIFQKNLAQFFSQASLNQFTDMYPLVGLLHIKKPLLESAIQRLILLGDQKYLSDARGMLALIQSKDQRFLLLERLLSRTPDPETPGLYQAFIQKNGFDVCLSVALMQWCIRTDQGERAYALRQSVPRSCAQKYDTAFTHLDTRIMRQLLQEGQKAETQGDKKRAGHLYKMAVSLPLLPHNDKTANAHWTKGFIYWVGLQDYRRALEHFVQAAPSITPPVGRSKKQDLGHLLSHTAHQKGLTRHDVRALFWCGLCHEYMKNKDLAKSYYTLASAYGTYFYGQWAAYKINRPIQLNFASAQPGVKCWKNSGQKEALFIIETWKNHYSKNKSSNGKKARPYLPPYDTTFALCKDLSDLAHTPGDKAKALDLIAKIYPNYAVEATKFMAEKSNSVFKRLYPILPTTACQDPALVHSIILAESCFNHTAYSWDGGIGIMQIMPKTGEQAAKELGIRLDMNRLSKDQAYQIRLGSHIIMDYFKKMGFWYPAGIASYNAGVKAAQSWIAHTPNLPIPEEGLIWIESIPFATTHHYVLTVMESYAIYRTLMGQNIGHKEWIRIQQSRP